MNELLLSALVEVKFKGKLLFTSSVQEYSGTLYGKAKKDARLKFKESSKKLGFKFYGINKFFTYWRSLKNSLSSSKFQKLSDGYRVYRFYLEKSFFASIYHLLILSLNFLKK